MAPPAGDSHERTKFEQRLFAKPLSPRRAGRLIAATTLTLTLAGGLAAWLLDANEVGSFGDSIWWAMQTVTTVGYGDVVPEDTTGRVIGAVLMLNGVALISVVTAVVTAALMEQARRRHAATEDDGIEQALARIESRLDKIEASLPGQGQAGER